MVGSAYNDSYKFGYTHEVIIHEEKNVDPEVPYSHSQNIENSWLHFKKLFKETSRTSHPCEYIGEYLNVVILIEEQKRLFGWIQSNILSFCSFVEFVKDGTKEILKVIQRRIYLDTKTVSEGWSANNDVYKTGYNHEVIIHEEKILLILMYIPKMIENFSFHLEMFLKENGKYRTSHQWEYICKYLFRKEFQDMFAALIKIINEMYPF